MAILPDWYPRLNPPISLSTEALSML